MSMYAESFEGHDDRIAEVETSEVDIQKLMVEKANELFKICDAEEKGIVTRRDIQRLKDELPLTSDQLEAVFDSLDEDQNGYLTLQEFTDGFGEKSSILHYYFIRAPLQTMAVQKNAHNFNSYCASLNEPPHNKTNKNDLSAQQRLRSAWASAQSEQSLHLHSLGSSGPKLSSCGQQKQRLQSDWAYAQADLSLRWAHMPFYWFCHEAAQMWFKVIIGTQQLFTSLKRKRLKKLSCL